MHFSYKIGTNDDKEFYFVLFVSLSTKYRSHFSKLRVGDKINTNNSLTFYCSSMPRIMFAQFLANEITSSSSLRKQNRFDFLSAQIKCCLRRERKIISASLAVEVFQLREDALVVKKNYENAILTTLCGTDFFLN